MDGACTSHRGSHPFCPRVCERRPRPGNDGLHRGNNAHDNLQDFAIYAGAVICFGGLIFAGIRMLSGRFQDAIPGLFGALFGAGVLGWGAGWIGSLTGQNM